MPVTGPPTVKPDVVFVESLPEELREGKLRVPRFQRPFVWRPADMVSLFDSIYKGYPIGSLLLWESSEPVESSENVGPIQIPHPSDKPLTHILDGHQRLATLFGVLRLASDAARGPEQEQWRWWIWFDLENESFTHVPKGDPLPWFLPLRSVLRTTDFLVEARRIQESCEQDTLKSRRLIERAETIAGKLKNYKVAITRIIGGNLDEAVEIFSRLNTKGRPMTLDQMVSALTYREKQGGMNLSNKIDEILDKLAGYHFGNIKRLTVFRAIVAAAEHDIHKSEWEKIAKKLGEGLARAIDSAEASLLLSARYLREEVGVQTDELLPYNLQMLMLSEFFRSCREPTVNQLEILRKWFWATSLSGWFAGANSTKINKALEEMRVFARNEEFVFEVMPLDDLARPFPDSFDMRSARIRALLIFLASLKPRELIGGGMQLDVTFLLREQGNRALVHVFDRFQGDLVSSPANRIFAKREPGRSVRDRLRDIGPGQDEILSSHAIPPEAYRALLENDAATFIQRRAAHLRKLEEEHIRKLDISVARQEATGETDIDTDDDE